jgi:hypothetical protein
MRNRAELETHLREQHRLLGRSVDVFYAGDVAEAMQIATRIRLLVHETGRSKPLLKKLRPDYLQLPIMDKNEVKSEDIVFAIPLSMMLMDCRLSPSRNWDPRSYEKVLLGHWWSRDSLIVPLKTGRVAFSREELVLCIANQDGGAHVDDDLPPKYRALIEAEPIRVNAGVTSDSVNLARYMVGQAGAELLDCIESAFEFVEPWPKAPPLDPKIPAIFLDDLSLSATPVLIPVR